MRYYYNKVKVGDDQEVIPAYGSLRYILAQIANAKVYCFVNNSHPVKIFVGIFSKLKCWLTKCVNCPRF